MSRIIGIDPGAHTGVATFAGGKLIDLGTVRPIYILEWIREIAPSRVIFEDSRLTSPVWSRGTSQAASMKIARNVGQVDGVCSLIDAACEILGIPAHGISPKGKGAKLNAEKFQVATGWIGKSNQHERDAAMVAYKYKGAK